MLAASAWKALMLLSVKLGPNFLKVSKGSLSSFICAAFFFGFGTPFLQAQAKTIQKI